MAPHMKNDIGSARQEALAALERVRRGSAVSDAMVPSASLLANDRALMTQLVYGVLRHQRYLDAWIRPFQRGPLDPVIRDILRLAFFQLGFLDRVPAYAVVNAAVEQAKARKPQAARLVNAVLRRGQHHEPQGLSLGEQYSHPDWLVQRWAERYGEHLESVLKADNQVPPLTLRVNLARTTRQVILEQLERESVAATPSAYLPEAIRVQGAVWLEKFAPFQDGLVSVQDESGMLVAWVLDAQPGERVCDMAVGLGGKAIHVLERTHGAIEITALDVSAPRLKLLQENLERSGYLDHIVAVRSPAEIYAKAHQSLFDRVILDAPCSGLGVLGRRGDARWKKKPGDVATLKRLQEELLEASLLLTKAGGTIVYSTCSTEPEETDQVISTVLKNHPRVCLDDVSPLLPHQELARYVEKGALVLAPGDLGMDGFYICRLTVGG